MVSRFLASIALGAVVIATPAMAKKKQLSVKPDTPPMQLSLIHI